MEQRQFSQYARILDRRTHLFRKHGCICPSNDIFMLTLKSIQSHMNDKLRVYGHVTVNEVYEMLGICKISNGDEVGWTYDEEHPAGDNFVDFGLYEGGDLNLDFANGFGTKIVLDFNVDEEL